MAPARLLLVNGSLVLATGILCGLPFYAAIVFGWSAERARAWRVAHAALVADGLLLLVTGILLPGLALRAGLAVVLAWSLATSGWAFVFALAGGAWAGRRGLSPVPLGAETLFFVGHAVGAAGSVVGVGLLLAGLVGQH